MEMRRCGRRKKYLQFGSLRSSQPFRGVGNEEYDSQRFGERVRMILERMKWTGIMKCLTFFMLPGNAVASVSDEAHVVHPQCGRPQLWVTEINEKLPKERTLGRVGEIQHEK